MTAGHPAPAVHFLMGFSISILCSLPAVMTYSGKWFIQKDEDWHGCFMLLEFCIKSVAEISSFHV